MTRSHPTVVAPTFRAALRSPSFRDLVLAHAAGTVAQLVLTLAVGLEVLVRTSSGPWLSVTVALGFAPYILFSGIAGVVADRWSRSAVVAWACAIRSVVAVVLAGGLAVGWSVEILVALAAVTAVAATASYPALAAATPECVPDHQLPAANALATGVENVSWIAGPGAFGLLVVIGLGPAAAVVACAGLFVLATGAAWHARLPHRSHAAKTEWLREAMAGLRVLVDEPAARRPMSTAVINNFLYGYLVVALVLLARSAGPTMLGWLNAALTVGAVASMLVVNHLAGRRRASAVLSVVMAGYAGVVALLGVVGPNRAGIVLVALAGAGSLVAEVIAVTLLQRAVPGVVAARLFGVYDQLNVGAIAIGSLLAGPLAHWWGPGRAVAVMGVTCLASTVLQSLVRPRTVIGYDATF